MRASQIRPALLIAAAAVILGLGSTAAMAFAGVGRHHSPSPAAPPSCAPPALPGSVVDVSLTDMGPMMGGGMMGGAEMGHGMGMMRITATPASVHAGPVSLRVLNRGAIDHEVVVMPLAAGQYVGQRPIGSNGEVDETGSLGEASQTCGSAEGDGIAPGQWSWTTVNLPAGRYELLCNIAGHYGSGMYTELDVS